MLVVKEMTIKLDAYLVRLYKFKKNQALIAKDLSIQQTYDDDSKAIWQINFTENTTMFFLIQEGKETILDSSQGKCLKVFHIFFYFNL